MNIHWILHSTICGLLATLAIVGTVIDVHVVVHPEEFTVAVRVFDRQLRLAGLTISSTKILLEYSHCEAEKYNEAEMRLFDHKGVPLTELIEDRTRDFSVSAFRYLHVNEDGLDLMGDISNVHARAAFARNLQILACVVLVGVFVIVAATRILPVSLVSKPTDGVSIKTHMLGQGLCTLIITSLWLLWWSIFIFSSISTILLGHVLREARDRCRVDFWAEEEYVKNHFEIRLLGRYIQRNGFPSGVSSIIYLVTISLVIVYMCYLFIAANTILIKDINGFKKSCCYLSESKIRMLSWYSRILPWQFVIILFGVSVYCTFLVANYTMVRGFPLNQFYFLFGNRAAVHYGLSLTGTLLDVGQGIYKMVCVSNSVVYVTVYMWLIVIPLVGVASRHIGKFGTKILQDCSILLLIRSLISWVTVAPTSMSILERPDCFEVPSTSDGNLKGIHLQNSCNDTMFSIHTVTVMCPAMLLFFYARYSRVVFHLPFLSKVAICVGWLICVSSSILILIISRHQYTADVHIGVCLTVLFFLTQSPAYKLLFQKPGSDYIVNNASVDRQALTKVLDCEILPVLNDCVYRLESYHLALSEMPNQAAAQEDIEKLRVVYFMLGAAIERAKRQEDLETQRRPAMIDSIIVEDKKDN